MSFHENFSYRLLTCCQNQIVGVDDRNNWNDLMTNFCGVITVSLLCHPLHDQG